MCIVFLFSPPGAHTYHTYIPTYLQITQQKDILDGGDEDEDDEGWFVGGLKFKKHVVGR